MLRLLCCLLACLSLISRVEERHIDVARFSQGDLSGCQMKIFSGGALFWRTRAINYVWSNKQSIGSSWFNAFTSNAGMIVVESGLAGSVNGFR